MLRVSTIALCCVLSANGAEIALSHKGAAQLVRKESKKSDDQTQSAKTVEGVSISRGSLTFNVQARKKPTCAEIKQGFHEAEDHSRNKFCDRLKEEGMEKHAPCCKDSTGDDCCADANDCQISEVYEAIGMGECNKGAGASLVMQTRGTLKEPPAGTPWWLNCTSIDKQFKLEGDANHTITTFCAQVTEFALEALATCCQNTPRDCCAVANNCKESEVNAALGQPECTGTGRRRRRSSHGAGAGFEGLSQK